jgi:hypothetical protein
MNSLKPIPERLSEFGRKGSSQNDESGIIDAILASVPVRKKFFVEFGIGPNWQDPEYVNGLEGNCVDLRNTGWSGLFMDGRDHPSEYKIAKEFVTTDNFNALLKKHNVPDDFSILSIDVDGQDYWIWQALDARYYQPEIVIIEMNPNFSARDLKTVPRDTKFVWDGTKYFGASLGALTKLGGTKGYQLVYANGVNAFFVDKALVLNPDDFVYDNIFVKFNQHAYDEKNRAYVEV